MEKGILTVSTEANIAFLIRLFLIQIKSKMKRIVWLFAIAAVVLCASCKKDESAKPELESMVLVPSSVGATTDMRSQGFIDIFTVRTVPATYDKYNVVYKSSNPDVVDIRTNGRLRIGGVGEAIVTATLDGKTATCRFEVQASTAHWPMEIDPENPLMIYLNEPSIRLGVDQMTKPEFTVFPTTAAVSNRSFNISNRGANLIENMGDGDIMGIEPGSDTLIMSMRARPNVTPAQERPRFISVAIPITVYKQ